jgi:anti-anti-sigma regulatory factor
MSLMSEKRKEYHLLRPLDEWNLELQREIETEILWQATTGRRSFVIDLGLTSHIQFRVLPELLGFFRQIRKLGGELVISGPSSYLLEILAAGDVPRNIPVFTTENGAAMGVGTSNVAFVFDPQEGEREGSGQVHLATS